MPFEFERTDIEDVVLVKPDVFEDERGFLLETYDRDAFEAAGISTEFVLQFYSRSAKGVLRGLHQQADPYQQAKLIRCFSGRIFDVAVDVRPESDTYGQYVSSVLSADNKHALFVPRGFVHGFVALTDDALVHYAVDNEYAPDYERGVIWNDPDIGIEWPVQEPLVSEKDRNWPRLRASSFANARRQETNT